MAQTQVHNTLSKAARMVTINHPNAFDAVCFKRIMITESGINEIDGIMVLGAEESSDTDFQELGMAKVLFVESWQSSALINDGINANDSRTLVQALIEPDIENAFELARNDILYLYIDEKSALCYEIMEIENPIGLPTAMNAKRYHLNKRDDLDYYEALP